MYKYRGQNRFNKIEQQSTVAKKITAKYISTYAKGFGIVQGKTLNTLQILTLQLSPTIFIEDFRTFDNKTIHYTS